MAVIGFGPSAIPLLGLGFLVLAPLAGLLVDLTATTRGVVAFAPLALAALVMLYRVATIEIRIDGDTVTVRNLYRTYHVPVHHDVGLGVGAGAPRWLNHRRDFRMAELRVGAAEKGIAIPVMATTHWAHGTSTTVADFSAWWYAETGRHLRGAPRPTGRRPSR